MISRKDHSYLAAADVLRIVAIGLVAWFHLWQQSWLNPGFRIGTNYIDIQRIIRCGYMGVDLMLLLSGFLLYLPCAKKSAANLPIINASEFYHKRIFRIFPSYLLAVIIALLFAVFTGREAGSAPLFWDFLSHLTMTHTFSRPTYIWSSLNVALWTVAIEVQFYLVFPWIAGAFTRRPGVTCCSMIFLSLLCRCLIFPLNDVSMLFNQLPCMLDVYALGMLAAYLCAKDKKPSVVYPFLSLAALCGIGWVLWMQNAPNTLDAQHAQIIWRLPLAVLGGVFLYAGALWPSGFSRTLGNPVTRFLSSISYNFYIWHQYLSVKLKKYHLPPYLSEMPQRDEGVDWQRRYFWLSLGMAILFAAILTYLFERPVYKKLMHHFRKKTAFPK